MTQENVEYDAQDSLSDKNILTVIFLMKKKSDSKFHISTTFKFEEVIDNCTKNTRDLV